jgi:hypothetical protein
MVIAVARLPIPPVELDDFRYQLTIMYDAALNFCETAISSIPVLSRKTYAEDILGPLIERLGTLDDLFHHAEMNDNAFKAHLKNRQCLKQKLTEYMLSACRLIILDISDSIQTCH